jgi:hypothetical protein
MHNKDKSPPSEKLSTCVAAEMGGLLFDYLNEMLVDEEADEFEMHLLDCDECYQSTVTLDWMKATLRDITSDVPALESSVLAGSNHPLFGHPLTDTPHKRAARSPVIYVVLGGLGVLGLVGLVGLGFIGLTKVSKLKRSNMAGQEMICP